MKSTQKPPILLKRHFLDQYVCLHVNIFLRVESVTNYPADLTWTSYRIEIHFAVFNHLYLVFSFMKLVETL